MADVQGLDVPVESRLKLRSVVRLNNVDAEREPPKDVADEADRRVLVARVVQLEDSNARAIVGR